MYLTTPYVWQPPPSITMEPRRGLFKTLTRALTFSRSYLPSLLVSSETTPPLPSPVFSPGNAITLVSLSAAWPGRVWRNERDALQHVLHI